MEHISEPTDKPVIPTVRWTSKSLMSLLLVSSGSLLTVVLTRQPGSGGPITILLFLSLLFLVSFCLMLYILRFIYRLIGKTTLSTPRLFYSAVLFSTGLIFLIGLQTLRQLQIIDIVLITLFEMILGFYLLRRF